MEWLLKNYPTTTVIVTFIGFIAVAVWAEGVV